MMYKGTKVVCINNFPGEDTLAPDLTLNKVYILLSDVDVDSWYFYTKIVDDSNTEFRYHKSRFITLDVHRQQQLDKVL